MGELAKIFQLADLDHDSNLSKIEFFIAMKLITKRSSGIVLPNTLPLDIYNSLGLSPPTKSTLLTVHSNDDYIDNEENKFETEKKKKVLNVQFKLKIQIENSTN